MKSDSPSGEQAGWKRNGDQAGAPWLNRGAHESACLAWPQPLEDSPLRHVKSHLWLFVNCHLVHVDFKRKERLDGIKVQTVQLLCLAMFLAWFFKTLFGQGLIENPAFSSQTKEQMTLKVRWMGVGEKALSGTISISFNWTGAVSPFNMNNFRRNVEVFLDLSQKLPGFTVWEHL